MPFPTLRRAPICAPSRSPASASPPAARAAGQHRYSGDGRSVTIPLTSHDVTRARAKACVTRINAALAQAKQLCAGYRQKRMQHGLRAGTSATMPSTIGAYSGCYSSAPAPGMAGSIAA